MCVCSPIKNSCQIQLFECLPIAQSPGTVSPTLSLSPFHSQEVNKIMQHKVDLALLPSPSPRFGPCQGNQLGSAISGRLENAVAVIHVSVVAVRSSYNCSISYRYISHTWHINNRLCFGLHYGLLWHASRYNFNWFDASVYT